MLWLTGEKNIVILDEGCLDIFKPSWNLKIWKKFNIPYVTQIDAINTADFV